MTTAAWLFAVIAALLAAGQLVAIVVLIAVVRKFAGGALTSTAPSWLTDSPPGESDPEGETE